MKTQAWIEAARRTRRGPGANQEKRSVAAADLAADGLGTAPFTVAVLILPIQITATFGKNLLKEVLSVASRSHTSQE